MTDAVEAPDAPPDDDTVDPDQVVPGGISQWEFLNRVPTREEVMDLLGSLPPVWGVHTSDFADYVQTLPQRKKLKIPHPTNPNVLVDQQIEAFTLYMSVAGRIKMIEEAQEQHGWTVDFEPEPVTPTGAAGYIGLDPRIVYREYVVISNDGSPLGRKPGTAWVPATGGSNAAGSNPYEKVETSARGRAIAAWGFGVLPGSGVASAEEMLGARFNKAHLDVEEAMARGGGGRQSRKSRGDLLQEALTTAEEVRQARGMDEEAMQAKVGTFLTTNLGIANGYDAEAKIVRWDLVKDGQIQLLINSLRDTLTRVRAEQADL